MSRQEETQQLLRIRQMEDMLDRAAEVMTALDAALEAYRGIRPELAELIRYYEGGLWQKDYEDDAAGRIPADLKRGVLSQDAVFDLLTDDRRLREEMLALGAADEEDCGKPLT